jgi:hypothetical protein
MRVPVRLRVRAGNGSLATVPSALSRMPAVVAQLVADGEVLGMAVAAFAAWLDVLQRSRGVRHMLATNPAGHHSV